MHKIISKIYLIVLSLVKLSIILLFFLPIFLVNVSICKKVFIYYSHFKLTFFDRTVTMSYCTRLHEAHYLRSLPLLYKHEQSHLNLNHDTSLQQSLLPLFVHLQECIYLYREAILIQNFL